MDGWMDGWTDRWTEGGMSGWMCIYESVHVHAYRCWDTRLPQKAAMVRGIHGKHNMAFCSLAVNPLDTILAAGTIFEEEESTVILWYIVTILNLKGN